MYPLQHSPIDPFFRVFFPNKRFAAALHDGCSVFILPSRAISFTALLPLFSQATSFTYLKWWPPADSAKPFVTCVTEHAARPNLRAASDALQ